MSNLSVRTATVAPAAELTLLFSDIEGSTNLVREYGREYDQILEKHFALLRTAVTNNHGVEVIAHSDAFFATFEQARDAVAAAVEIRRAMASEAWPFGAKVMVRLGLHTGRPIPVSDPKVGYIGIDVHRAARISDAGNGGQILISSATMAALRGSEKFDQFDVRYVGVHRLRDLQYPEHLYEIAPSAEVERRLRSVDARMTNLPTSTNSFVGRERDIAKISELLTDPSGHIVTLTGPGGSGKTRLAIEISKRLQDFFSDGVFFVSLEAIAEESLVLPAIAQVLGVLEFPGRSLLDGLKRIIGSAKTLLVIDNFEQVASGAAQIGVIANACPNLRLLITSRELLHVPMETEYRVAPLALTGARASPSEAILLFEDRAKQVVPGFSLSDDNAETVAEICRRLDGLPLALELAASRLKFLSVPELLSRLSAGLDVVGRSGKTDRRHSTLKNAVDWSYRLLGNAEQKAFAELSIFSGGFRLESAEVVQGENLLEVVSSLCEKNLLIAENIEGEPRFRMLETIRKFGFERLAADRLEHLKSVHATYFLGIVESMAKGFVGSSQRRHVTWVRSEEDNIRAAISWSLESGRTEMTGRFSKALLWYWIPRGRFTEGLAWLERAVASLPENANPYERATILDVYGWLRMISGDYAGALPLFERAHDLYRDLDLDGELAGSMTTLGITKAVTEGGMEGPEMIMAALEKQKAADNPYGTALALIALGEGARAGGDYDAASECYEEALNLMQDADDLYWTGALLLNLANVHIYKNDWDQASKRLKRVFELAQEYDYPMMINLYVALKGRLALKSGDARQAARLFGAVDALLSSLDVHFEPADQAELDQSIAEAKGLLADAYADEYAAGRSLPRDQAIALTLS